MRTIQEILEEGFIHHAAGDHIAAAHIYDRLLGATDGKDPNVLYAYGTLMGAAERWGLAAFLLQNSAQLFPNHAPTWTNLGVALKSLDRDEAARACYLKALEVEPDGAEPLAMLSGWYVNRGESKTAEKYARQALETKSDMPQAHNHLALSLMEQGRFSEAWPHYAHRWELPERQKDRRPFKCPEWDGRPVGTLAIHGEQGLGDEILFLSCLSLVKADRILIECATRLVNWFSLLGHPCYPTAQALLAAEGEPDAFIPMGSLPGLVGLPDGNPYLPRIADPVPGRIGYAWKGGTRKTNKGDRSLKKEWIEPILSIPGYEFVSVQYEDETRADFDGLNATLASCELVITVCQTAVHQAGAMGIPCWVLVPHRYSWQFSPAFGDKMAWWNSVTLYRQGADFDWQPVIKRIADDLAAYAKECVDSSSRKLRACS